MTTNYCLMLLLGVVLLCTASVADHHETSKHREPPVHKQPPKHKPPTTLAKEEEPFPGHKPPTPGDKPPKGEGEKPPPKHKPPHEDQPGRHLLESSSLEENSPSLDGKPHKGKKPPPKRKPPTTLAKEEEPFPGHKQPTPGDKPPKGEGEKPPPKHKPPHEDQPGRHLLESSSLEENSPSLDGKPHKGKKPPPKRKPPTTLSKEEEPFPGHKPQTPGDKPPKGEGEKPPPKHKPPHEDQPGRHLLESSWLEENSPSLDGKPHKGKKPPPKRKPPTTLAKEEEPFPGHKPQTPGDKPPKGEGVKPPPKHKSPHEDQPGRHLLEFSSVEEDSPSVDGKHHKGKKPPPKHKPPTTLGNEEKPFPADKPPKGKGEKPPRKLKPPTA